MNPTLLDTDLLSEVIKQRNSTVVAHAAQYLAQFGQFAFSSVTRYEIQRGYLSVGATTAITRFETLCQHSSVLAVSDSILDRAAQLWADAFRGGFPQGDADLMIAATAMEHGLSLATGNIPHFSWIPGLKIENWRLP
jgi:tRNA(fMet)-specific endonuclease VapC